MTEKIQAGLMKLDVKNDNHWTAEGQPKVEAVRFLAGDQSLSREDITKAAPDFSRTNPSLEPVEKQGITATPIVKDVVNGENGDASADTIQGLVNSLAQTQQEGEEPSLATQLARARRRLESAKEDKAESDAFHREAEAEVDRLIEAGAANLESDSFAASLTLYHASQAKIREERARRLQAIKTSGVSLKDLLPSKAPIETAIATSVRAAQKARAANTVK